MATANPDRRHIVAVFGGNEVSDDVGRKARALAEHCVESRAIVLSGGDGRNVRTRNVKDEANGAARPKGRWISVLNTTGKSRDCLPEGGGIVVRPEAGNQRNLLEAWMSDACLVLGSGAGEGTLSELVSALCLGRPVLLIADPSQWSADSPWSWVHHWFVTGQVDEKTSGRVVDLARRKLGDVHGPMVDLVQTTVAAKHLRLVEQCACLGLSEDEGATSWITDRLAQDQLGSFPAIAPPSDTERSEFQAIKATYEAWVASPHPPRAERPGA